MAKKLNAAQRRYIENALLIAALGLTFKKLEEDYETKPLGEIAETTSGGTPLRNMSMYYGGNIPWIKSGELNDNLIESAEEYITEEGLANSSTKIYPKGTLVVALYGATVGKTGILGLDAASNQAVCAVFPKTKEITNEFIFWFLRHKRPEFLGMSFGGAQPNISQKIIRETQIPILPLELQKTLADFFALIEKRQSGNTNNKYPTLPDAFADVLRIVTLIESLAARVNAAQRLRKEVDSEINSLLLAAYHKTFEPKDDWIVAKVGDFCDNPQYGYTESAKSEPVGIKYLRITDIQNGKVNWDGVPYCECPNPEKYLLKPNDIVFARTGATTGKSFLIKECPDSVFASYLIRLRVQHTVTPEYLYAFFQSPDYWQQITDEKKGTGQPNVNGQKLINIRVPAPPLDEQRRIVAYLEGLQAKVNALRELQSQSQEELDALLPSILDKAFKGEL